MRYCCLCAYWALLCISALFHQLHGLPHITINKNWSSHGEGAVLPLLGREGKWEVAQSFCSQSDIRCPERWPEAVVACSGQGSEGVPTNRPVRCLGEAKVLGRLLAWMWLGEMGHCSANKHSCSWLSALSMRSCMGRPGSPQLCPNTQKRAAFLAGDPSPRGWKDVAVALTAAPSGGVLTWQGRTPDEWE